MCVCVLQTFPDGGSWILKVRKGNGVINRLWEELCFAAIGEWFADSDVVGIVLSTRAKDGQHPQLQQQDCALPWHSVSRHVLTLAALRCRCV